LITDRKDEAAPLFTGVKVLGEGVGDFGDNLLGGWNKGTKTSEELGTGDDRRWVVNGNPGRCRIVVNGFNNGFGNFFWI